MLHTMDVARKFAGTALDQWHLGPVETANGPPVLLVPAPIKRPYILDLLSAVRVVQ